MTLYEIKMEYEKALAGLTIDETTGEVLGTEALDEIAGEFDEKAENVALFVKNLLADVDAIKAEADALAQRAAAKKKKADRLKAYLTDAMLGLGREKIETPRVALTFRQSEAVELTDTTKIPQKFVETVTEQKISKTEIKKAIKAGEAVPGAELVTHKNIQIK